MHVYTDRAPDVTPAASLTYEWRVKENIETGRNPIFYNELNDQRIKKAVNNEMTRRGYLHTERNAQLLLHYHIVVEDKPYVAIPYDYSYNNLEYWAERHTISTYRQGTLIIDVMDESSCNLIWRGWVVAVLDEISRRSNPDEIITKAVAKIFQEFPRCAVTRREPSVSESDQDRLLIYKSYN